jgi:hypothetical protein
LIRDKDLRELYKVKRIEIEDKLANIERGHRLERDACASLYYVDDFVSTRLVQVHSRIESFLYSRLIKYLFVRKSLMSGWT